MELKEKILKLMNAQRTGVLSTIRNGKPHSHFMMFFHEDMTMYAATDIQSKKIQDIKQNPDVHVLLGQDGINWDQEFLEIQGTAEMTQDPDLKNKFWTNTLKRWLNGPEDPNYVLLKITPTAVYYIDKAGAVKPEVLTL
ncbi:pyridoxamine 5'-phosphate oxidase family protein [Bacillus sp. 165]|uniref:pyridoxamine 5'-phosphate oxidase family protein n=1 Tax=Bacillus sp. 165 TaxID=1529117 RepID=UPI001ADAD1FA|nr:pyridoxamine 5'-phosphate oxidase family protein [Bacillus sp. 165]MBO9131447.1 pyridoxamine 5'-phosphate oxidase family protein [Bacillus sp. 165]